MQVIEKANLIGKDFLFETLLSDKSMKSIV
jgi:hypothetical protein